MATEGIKRHVAKNGQISWRVRVELPPDPVTGKRRGAMKTFHTKTAAEVARASWLTEIERGIAVDASKLTVGEYLTSWLADVQANKRPTTANMYRYHITKYVLPELGSNPLQKLTPARLKAHIDAARTPNIGKVSRRLLHIAFQEAVNLNLLAINPADRVKAPTTPKPKRRAWSADQVARFLEVVVDDGYQPLWTLAAYTGMRLGELLGLRWADLDLDAGRLYVRQQITPLVVDGERITQAPKSESGERAIDLPPEVMEALRAHKVRQLEQRLAASRWEDHDLVCPSRVGTAISHRNADRRFQQLRERAGLPHLTPHGMRHTAATVMLANGTQIHDVSAILGHSNPTTTAAIYAQSLREQRRAATAALAMAFKRVTRKAD